MDQSTVHNINHIKEQLNKEFEVTNDQLHTVINQFTKEMEKGLDQEGATVPMIPSFITKRPTGKEMGRYLALALSDNTLRVCAFELKGQCGTYTVQQQRYIVSEQLKRGDMEDLFDFIADCLDNFMEEHGLHRLQYTLPLGFSFSFPFLPSAINRGKLMYWTKGYHCSSSMDKDIVLLLQHACASRYIKVRIIALVNDTIGTLMGYTYLHPETNICIILGTGVNACYFEKAENIKKWKGEKGFEEMVINMEWGAFDNEKQVLPLTIYDNQLDRESNNPKQQIYEKTISSYYLGELVRNVMMYWIDQRFLFNGHSSHLLNQQWGMKTAYIAMILKDTTNDFTIIRQLLLDTFNISSTFITLEDCQLVKYICELVTGRAAKLAAAGLAALLSHMGLLQSSSSSSTVIAVNGYIFESLPDFELNMLSTLKDLFGASIQDRIKFTLEKNCSCLGASIAAMVSS
ncbi:unnamed protein product [Cunninghamella echinulata]